MQIKLMASAFAVAALASLPCAAQLVPAAPLFAVQVIQDSGTFAITDVDSLVLKQVVNPASRNDPPPSLAPPCLYTLTLTKYGDDSDLFAALTPETQVRVTFKGLQPDGNGNTSYFVVLNQFLTVRCLTSGSMLDGDFDSIDDIGMEKITLTFNSAQIGPLPTKPAN